MTRFPTPCLILIVLIWSTAALASDVTFERRYVDLEWGQIHLLSATPTQAATAAPMVCFAPTPYSGNYYRLLMRALGQDRTVLAPDYPGLGQSDRPDSDLDIAAHADIMADMLIAAGWGPEANGPVDACGYHTGAFVATELALRHPDLVRRVVLIGIPFYEGSERSERYQNLGSVRPLPDSFAALGQDWIFAVDNRAPGVTLDRGYSNFLESAAAWQNKARMYAAVFQYPAEQRAPLLQHPTLVLNPHGNLKEPTRAFAALLPNSVLVELPDLKYGIFDTAPDVIASESRAFLNAP